MLPTVHTKTQPKNLLCSSHLAAYGALVTERGQLFVAEPQATQERNGQKFNVVAAAHISSSAGKVCWWLVSGHSQGERLAFWPSIPVNTSQLIQTSQPLFKLLVVQFSGRWWCRARQHGLGGLQQRITFEKHCGVVAGGN